MSREWEKVGLPPPIVELLSYSRASQFVSENSVPPIYPDIPTARETIEKRGRENQSLLPQPALAALNEKVTTTNTTITLPEVPGHNFKIRIYAPSSGGFDKLPVLLYFHGGMWVAGDLNTEDLGVRAMIAHGNDMIIISFDYRKAPENDWKTIFSEGERALNWTIANASKYGGDISQGLLIGGADSGAHLAAITVLRARKTLPRVKITGQIFIVPIFISQPDQQIPEAWHALLKSHVDMVDAPLMNEMLVQRYLNVLGVPDSERRKGENFPVWADLKGLPPAYLAMDECDPTRDDGFLYDKLLADAGVKTRVDFYRGLPNMFVQFPELATTPRAGVVLSSAVRWLLHRPLFNEYQGM
jgi:versiconal hemiacetal acetate esterase